MPISSIRSWLGLDRTELPSELAPLRATLDALDHLPPERARYLGAFAYLLGRVAHADQHVSADETHLMEALVQREGGLPTDQAVLVVHLAQANHRLFAGTADFLIAREFGKTATYEQKRDLLRCLFAVAATDAGISTAEESEIHRIAKELRIEQADLIAMRVAHRQHLPGMSRD